MELENLSFLCSSDNTCPSSMPALMIIIMMLYIMVMIMATCVMMMIGVVRTVMLLYSVG